MHIIFSALLFISALPPNSIPVTGCFFLLPVLVHHYDKPHEPVWISSLLLGTLISSYVFFGAWTYSLEVYLLAIILTSVAFTLLVSSICFLVKINCLAALVIAPGVWLGMELILQAFHIPATFSIVLTPINHSLLPAALGGQYLLEILLIAFQVLLFIVYIKFKPTFPRLPAVVITLSASIIYLSSYIPLPVNNYKTAETLSVSIVQTNIHPGTTLNMASDGNLESLNAARRNYIKSIMQRPGKHDLIIWPEVNFSKYEFRNKVNISELARLYKVNMLISSPDIDPSGNSFSSIFAVSSGGKVLSRRSKKVLIPFIEDEMTPDNIWQPHFQLPGKPGTLVCFESAFSAPAVTLAKFGSGFLVISTNESYAGPSIIPVLHFELARIRAIETGKTVLRAANGGVSAIITPDGRVIKKLPLFNDGIIHADIQTRYDDTFFVHYYDEIMNIYRIFSSLSFLILIMLVVFQKKSLPTTTLKYRPVMFTGISLALFLAYQQFLVQYIFASETHKPFSASFINFQDGFVDKEYSYESLKASSAEASLVSSITYLLRDNGNITNTGAISTYFSNNNAGQINIINTIASQFDYTIDDMNYALDKNLNITTPCLALLDTGETVVIRLFDNNKTIIFSPFYASELVLKTDAFIKKWTGRTLILKSGARHWD